MRALGAEPDCVGRVYITGGGSAVLVGWRPQTADADLLLVPDSDAFLRAIQRLKLSLRMNVELSSPDHFLPELPGWQERSTFIVREGRVDFFHYDFNAQALSKILRGQESRSTTSFFDFPTSTRSRFARQSGARWVLLRRTPERNPENSRRSGHRRASSSSAVHGVLREAEALRMRATVSASTGPASWPQSRSLRI